MRLRRVEPVLRRALLGPCRVADRDRVLVAVSGGADSTALLVALASIARERRLELHAAHLDHRLRAADSDADAAFVAELCARLRVPLHAARWDTRARMRRRGLAGENGLRTLRREFLLGLAETIGAGAIATAHTADDQFETVLLRLMRGAGLRGLGGMRPRHGRWIKPLLEATRADIERDLRAAGQAWREDASNRSAAFARNRVRHAVVPAIVAALRPAAARAAHAGDPEARRTESHAVADRAALARRVAALAAEMRDAELALRRWTRPLARASAPGADGARIDAVRLRRYPPAARRELLRGVWRRLAPAGIGLTAAHLGQLERLALGARGPVGLPAGFSARREEDTIRLCRNRIQRGVRSAAEPAENPRRSARAKELRPPAAARLRAAAAANPAPVGRDFRKQRI